MQVLEPSTHIQCMVPYACQAADSELSCGSTSSFLTQIYQFGSCMLRTPQGQSMQGAAQAHLLRKWSPRTGLQPQCQGRACSSMPRFPHVQRAAYMVVSASAVIVISNIACTPKVIRVDVAEELSCLKS